MKMNYEAEEERAIQIREFFKEDEGGLRRAAEDAESVLSAFMGERWNGTWQQEVLNNLRKELQL